MLSKVWICLQGWRLVCSPQWPNNGIIKCKKRNCRAISCLGPSHSQPILEPVRLFAFALSLSLYFTVSHPAAAAVPLISYLATPSLSACRKPRESIFSRYNFTLCSVCSWVSEREYSLRARRSKDVLNLYAKEYKYPLFILVPFPMLLVRIKLDP